MNHFQRLFPDVEHSTLASSIRFSTDKATTVNRLLAQGFQKNQSATTSKSAEKYGAKEVDSEAHMSTADVWTSRNSSSKQGLFPGMVDAVSFILKLVLWSSKSD